MREININLNDTKKQLEKLKGVPLNFTVNRGRNKFVNYSGKIGNLYPYIFTVEVDDEDIPLQSFAYSDILTKNVRIYPR